MTLVVAGAENGVVTIVAITKITWDEDAIKSARVFEEALTKIVLLRDDLAVAVAGDFPDRVIHDIMRHRHRDVPDVLNVLASDTRCDYVVATLDPVRIWRIVRGEVEERDLAHRTSIGDADAFSRFQSTNGRFRFAVREFYVAGNSPGHGYHGMQLPGAEPTPGATAIYIPRAKVGRVFRHEDPSSSLRIVAETPERFVAVAQEQAQQTLVYWEPSTPFGLEIRAGAPSSAGRGAPAFQPVHARVCQRLVLSQAM